VWDAKIERGKIYEYRNSAHKLCKRGIERDRGRERERERDKKVVCRVGRQDDACADN
jgi:hypothetical protein